MNWYAPWQSSEHVTNFDYRVALDDRNLVRLYETLNDVRLFRKRFSPAQRLTLLEVGCATGDFYRYLRLVYHDVSYYGIDIAAAAIARAKEKYPTGRFIITVPGAALAPFFTAVAGRPTADIVFAADVIHHQTQPLSLLLELIRLASQAVILRCRTRDVGPTEWDPHRSRQRHYGMWVPYIVMNLHELIAHLQQVAVGSEILIYQNYAMLGGRHGRELPAACSLQQTGTAETAVGVFFNTAHPGRVTIRNRVDNRPHTTWDYKLKSLQRKLVRLWRHA